VQDELERPEKRKRPEKWRDDERRKIMERGKELEKKVMWNAFNIPTPPACCRIFCNNNDD
jgi:hypothetical protein